MDTVSMEIMWKIDQFSAKSLSAIAEACSRLGYGKEPTYDWLARRVHGRLEDYSPEDMATVMWSFAHASLKADALFTSTADVVAKKWLEMNEQDLSRLLLA